MGAIGEVHVKVSTEVLNAKADSVSKSITIMENCFRELKEVIDRTAYYWIGEAGDQHRRMYIEQQQNIDEMVKRLREHPRDLQTISQTYVTTERAVQEMADVLPGDVIE